MTLRLVLLELMRGGVYVLTRGLLLYRSTAVWLVRGECEWREAEWRW
jgi:hypothetical protein